MIVQYYADSLGLSRPGAVTLEQRYIFLFEEWLKKKYPAPVHLTNRARRGFTIDKLYEIFQEDEEYIDGQKDLLIIHEGVCDCAPRPISQRLRGFISKLPAFIRIRTIGYIHKNRARILKRGRPHYLVGKARYQQILEKWLAKAVKNFKQIYILTIAPTNESIEAHSPGFSDSIDAYNTIIKTLVAKMADAKIKIIDVNQAVKEAGPLDDYIIKEDGHHITAAGHALYARLLIKEAEAGIANA
jgi:acyl-CoA thioesterase I